MLIGTTLLHIGLLERLAALSCILLLLPLFNKTLIRNIPRCLLLLLLLVLSHNLLLLMDLRILQLLILVVFIQSLLYLILKLFLNAFIVPQVVLVRIVVAALNHVFFGDSLWGVQLQLIVEADVETLHCNSHWYRFEILLVLRLLALLLRSGHGRDI